MKAPHLAAAVMAIVLAVAASLLTVSVAERVEDESIHALGPRLLPLKNQGSALQRAAFRQPDLLPVYGSSELKYRSRYDAATILADYPTGFTISPVGANGSASLIAAQHLASVGPCLKGRKIVISLSPSFFLHAMSAPEVYAGNFSAMHAHELAFSADLSHDLKRDIARRMLDYPDTLANEPLLGLALANLADDSWRGRIQYHLLRPVGALRVHWWRVQDHWATLEFIRAHPEMLGAGPRDGRDIDWQKLARRARDGYRNQSGNNPFGFDNGRWLDEFQAEAAAQRGAWNDAEFLANMNASQEWADFDLLLRTVRELEGEPLVLSMPIPEAYYTHLGVSPTASRAYYAQLRAAASARGAAVVDFAEHATDKEFLADPHYHLSAKGWVHYAHALDAFYHDRLPYTLPDPDAARLPTD